MDPRPCGDDIWVNGFRLTFYERQKGHDAGAFDRVRELALVERAGAGLAARQDFGVGGEKTLGDVRVLGIDVVGLVHAKVAGLGSHGSGAGLFTLISHSKFRTEFLRH